MMLQPLSFLVPFGLALLILAVHFTSFDIIETPLVTDVRYYVYFAWRVAEGAVPHVGFFGNKTQLAAMVGGAMMSATSAFADPLIAVRIGFLAVAAGTGLAAFFIHRRLARGSAVAGLLGVIGYCAFPLLVFLPSVGNVPKLLTAACASVMGLCVYRGRWFWAGFAGAVGFMDWQVGALAGVGAVAAALSLPEKRWARAATAAAGGLTGLGLFLIYFAWNDALGAAIDQTLLASFFRGATTLADSSLTDRLGRILARASASAPHSHPLLLVGLLGIGVALRGWWRQRDLAEGRMLLALSIHHAGVVGFSLVDFQGYGDLFILLHSGVFFLTLGLNGIRETIIERLGRYAGTTPRRRQFAEAMMVIAAIALARPGPLRPEVPIPIVGVAPGLRLADQMEVAAQIEAELGGRRLLFLRNAEIPFLMRYRNPLPFIYWNSASYRSARRSEQEGTQEAAQRLVREVDPDAYAIWLRDLGEPVEGYGERTFASRNRRYQMNLFVRQSGV